MAKILYSLMLDPEIIGEIDKLAYRQQTSRSNFINEILAGHIRVATPQKRQKNIFDALEEIIGQSNTMQVMLTNSSNLLSIRSPLSYSYNPTIRYNVALQRERGETAGEIKIGVRTQNEGLRRHLNQFFTLLIEAGKKWGEGLSEYQLEDGKLTQTFRLPSSTNTLTDREVGQLVAEYIAVIDNMLSAYFTQVSSDCYDSKKIEQIYKDYIADNTVCL